MEDKRTTTKKLGKQSQELFDRMERFDGGSSDDESSWVMVGRADLPEEVARDVHENESRAGSRRGFSEEMDSESSGEEDELLKVEFFDPAAYWTEALPLGNGRLGAMVFGGVPCDLLQLNDDTLWSGGPKDWNNAHAREVLPQVRDLVFQGHYSEATKLSLEMLGPYCQTYQPLGDIKLDFGAAHEAFDPNSYHRLLDLERATSSLTYTVDDVSYTREYFISQPHQVLVAKLSADKASSVSVAVTLSSQLQESSQVVNSNQIVVRGHAPGNLGSSSNEMGMAFTILLEVRIGGEKAVTESVCDQTVKVTNSDWVVVLVAAANGFEGPFKQPESVGKNASDMTERVMNKTNGLSYEALLEAHLKDYQPLFQRVSLSLSKSGASGKNGRQTGKRVGDGHAEESSVSVDGVDSEMERWRIHSGSRAGSSEEEGKAKISTMERVRVFKENQDPRMVTLLFQFGRYLLLSSSRPGTFIANLQGIWNKDLSPPWRCVPHININLPMNYWPAEVCNLAECHLPVFDLLATMAVTGTKTAQVNYGLDGWVGHHNVDVWGQTAPVAEDPVWALWPMGGAWLSLHLWEHYTFSLDKDFLRERAYPILRGCAQFLLAWLIEDEDGCLITNPSTSPEHYFVSPDTTEYASVAYASAMDMAIIREVFNSVVESSRILGNIDEELTSRVVTASGRLYPVKITSDGCLMEWGKEFEDDDIHHRHMSHLFGLYPGHTLTLETTPEFCEAAEKSMIKRGEAGPGWSMAWKTALWARLQNRKHAYSMVVRMFTLIESDETEESIEGGGLYGNLLNAHPPFQIDGNFGFTAALAEMLLQSDSTSLYFLPALPDEIWPSGKVTGLRGRGDCTVSISWDKGSLLSASVLFGEDVPLSKCKRKAHYNGRTVELGTASSTCRQYNFDKDLNARPVSA